MTYYLIGTGNMAAFLAMRMQASGHICLGIYGRNKEAAQELSREYHIPLLQHISEIHDGADICLLAVSDHSIKEVADKLSLKTTVLLHHSGSMPMSVLNSGGKNTAVVWPVYSILKKDLPQHRQFPCLWEAGSDYARRAAREVCTAISSIQYEADSNQRRWLHLTAVLGNNFTNYLLGMCMDICRQQGLPFNLLQPILQQTLDRVNIFNAGEVQTGPARRNDTETMNAHLALMHENPHWQAVYEALSTAIRNTTYGGA